MWALCLTFSLFGCLQLGDCWVSGQYDVYVHVYNVCMCTEGTKMGRHQPQFCRWHFGDGGLMIAVPTATARFTHISRLKGTSPSHATGTCLPERVLMQMLNEHPTVLPPPPATPPPSCQQNRNIDCIRPQWLCSLPCMQCIWAGSQ